MLQYDNLTLKCHWTEQHSSCAAPTCCRHDRGGERPNPDYCPAWCCDRGSGPSAAPLLASAGSAAAEGAASQRVAGMLQGQVEADKWNSIISVKCAVALYSCNMMCYLFRVGVWTRLLTL